MLGETSGAVFIRLIVCDHDTFGKPDFLGEVCLFFTFVLKKIEFK